MVYSISMKYFITSIVLITSLVINFGYKTAFARGSEDTGIESSIHQEDDQEGNEDQEDSNDDSSDDDSGDIETEVEQTMNQTSQDAQGDLKDQVKQVEATNKQKSSLRDGKSSETPIAPTSKDPNIVSVVVADDRVEMDYKQPAKLFGFIPVQLLIHSSVDATGRVKVKFPWLARLAKTNRAEVEAAVEVENEKLDSLGEVGDEQQLKLQLTMDQKSKFEEMLSNIMKKMSEATDNITENLK